MVSAQLSFNILCGLWNVILVVNFMLVIFIHFNEVYVSIHVWITRDLIDLYIEYFLHAFARYECDFFALAQGIDIYHFIWTIVIEAWFSISSLLSVMHFHEIGKIWNYAQYCRHWNWVDERWTCQTVLVLKRTKTLISNYVYLKAFNVIK